MFLLKTYRRSPTCPPTSTRQVLPQAGYFSTPATERLASAQAAFWHSKVLWEPFLLYHSAALKQDGKVSFPVQNGYFYDI